MAPLIGITGRRSVGEAIGAEAPHLLESPVDYYFAEYGMRLASLGAHPVELPQLDDPTGLVSRLDGLVLTGGGDVDPELWGGPPGSSFGVSRARDDYEIALFEQAIEHDVPILAICRGIQLVNVALGGTLVAHLEWDQGDQHSKRRTDRSARVHDVTFEPGSTLHRYYGDHAAVNSFHHQAIDRPAGGLVVTGRSPDGTIEGAEYSEGRVVCVQWHPEMMEPVEPAFTWLVEAAAL